MKSTRTSSLVLWNYGTWIQLCSYSILRVIALQVRCTVALITLIAHLLLSWMMSWFVLGANNAQLRLESLYRNVEVGEEPGRNLNHRTSAVHRNPLHYEIRKNYSLKFPGDMETQTQAVRPEGQMPNAKSLTEWAPDTPLFIINDCHDDLYINQEENRFDVTHLYFNTIWGVWSFILPLFTWYVYGNSEILRVTDCFLAEATDLSLDNEIYRIGNYFPYRIPSMWKPLWNKMP